MRRLGILTAIGMAGLLLAVMGVFAAVGFVCFSVYLYLVDFISPPLAALAAAFAALLFALAAAASASFLARRRQRSVADDFDRLAGALALGKAMGLESRNLLAARLSRMSMVAFGLGFLIGLSPRLRKLVSDFLFR